MFRKVVLAALAAITVLSSSTAFACGNTVATEQYGFGNTTSVTSRGWCNYQSAFQDAYRSQIAMSAIGANTTQVVGQSGVRNRINTDIAGRRNGLGVSQSGLWNRVDARMSGSDNNAAVYQRGSGGIVSLNVRGFGNTTVVRTAN